MQTPQSALVSSALTKHYGEVVALDGVSLRIEAGVTAVLGQNGAGKTTLIHCALGLTQPSAGDIRLFGGRPARRSSRQRVGVMLQDTELPELLTGRELLSLFASYYPQPLSVAAVIELARIGSFVDRRYKKLSGGQKRRIQFALAVVGNPDLVFLDEPTTGLDSGARKALWETVRAFADDGRAIVLTTHYLEEADALADRIVILKKGGIIADADAESIRGELGGSVIRCQTSVGQGVLTDLPGTAHVSSAGRITEIRSTDPVATLKALFERDDSVMDLTVGKPRLEDIFEEMNR